MIFRTILVFLFAHVLDSANNTCTNVNSTRKPDGCNTWNLYLYLLFDSRVAYDRSYKETIIFAEEILNVCRKSNQTSYITELLGDGSISIRNMSETDMETYSFYEKTRFRKRHDLRGQLASARQKVKESKIKTDGEAIYVLTDIPCEQMVSNRDLYGELVDFIRAMPSLNIPSRLLWITDENLSNVTECPLNLSRDPGKVGLFNYCSLDSPWDFSSDTLLSLGMCHGNVITDYTIDQFEDAPTQAPLDDPATKFVYIFLIVLVVSVSACAVFCTIRRLFYRSWRPWAPITDRICCCCGSGTRNRKLSDHRDTLNLELGKRSNSYVYTSPGKSIDKWEVAKENLEISEHRLGSGAYAVVYEAQLKGYPPAIKATKNDSLMKQFTDEKNRVAVKMPPLHATSEDREEFLREITFMKQLGFHSHLLTLLGCSTEQTFPLIVMELCDGGDLLGELVNLNNGKGQLLELRDLPHISWQICDALIYLNSLNIIHRDIAARNVLLKSNKFAKLGDFGLCRLSESQFYMARGGRLPVKWTAPEALERNEFSVKSDVWSFGVFLFEVFSLGQQPYNSLQPEEILPFLREGRRLDRPPEATDRIWKIMEWCWEFDPLARPKPQQIHKLLYREIENSISTYGYVDFHSNYYELFDEESVNEL